MRKAMPTNLPNLLAPFVSQFELGEVKAHPIISSNLIVPLHGEKISIKITVPTKYFCSVLMFLYILFYIVYRVVENIVMFKI